MAEGERQLTGRVEIDDAYLGGERSGGKAGRGSENKVPFVLAVQTTEDGRPHLMCLGALRFTKNAVEDFLATHTVLPMTLVSDGLKCFTVARGLGASHDREVTGGGKASATNAKFRAVNTLLSNVKTALSGTYHAVKFAKYGYRYLAEVQFRFNRRYDLRNAFLHRDLKELIYMEQSQGFQDIAFPHHVCRLRKSLYGLKQAPREWYHKLSGQLLRLGFTGSKTDTSLFFLTSGPIYILIYVDDILILGPSSTQISALVKSLSELFTLRDLGTASHFLGVEFRSCPTSYFLTQGTLHSLYSTTHEYVSV